MIRSRKQREHC